MLWGAVAGFVVATLVGAMVLSAAQADSNWAGVFVLAGTVIGGYVGGVRAKARGN